MTKINCIHRWVLTDLKQTIDYNGFEASYLTLYTITCDKCLTSKNVSEQAYYEMTRLGLISER